MIFKLFHDKHSNDFKSNVIAFELIHESLDALVSESIHEKLDFSKFSHFFTIIREI